MKKVAKRRRRKIQGVTMTDVAELAKVSPSTVSLFLRKPEAVTKKTGKIIQAAISELNYVPNMIAGGLAAASSRVVGVIVPSVRNAFFAETVASLQEELGRSKLQLLLGHSEYDLDVEEDLVRTALSWAPAAMVLTGLDHNKKTVDLLHAADIPVVQIWELGGVPPIDMAVGFNHYKVGERTALHLIERGYKTLAYLSGRIHADKRAAERANGFMTTAQQNGVTACHLTHPDSATTATGGDLLNQYLADGAQREGIGVGCSNDWIALGALFEAQRQEIRVPQDYAIIGFGDLSFAGSCNPGLTTVRPPGDRIGEETGKLIGSRLAKTPIDNPIVDTGVTEIHRQST